MVEFSTKKGKFTTDRWDVFCKKMRDLLGINPESVKAVPSDETDKKANKYYTMFGQLLNSEDKELIECGKCNKPLSKLKR